MTSRKAPVVDSLVLHVCQHDISGGRVYAIRLGVEFVGHSHRSLNISRGDHCSGRRHSRAAKPKPGVENADHREINWYRVKREKCQLAITRCAGNVCIQNVLPPRVGLGGVAPGKPPNAHRDIVIVGVCDPQRRLDISEMASGPNEICYEQTAAPSVRAASLT